jgi:hypothetical protein
LERENTDKINKVDKDSLKKSIEQKKKALKNDKIITK